MLDSDADSDAMAEMARAADVRPAPATARRSSSTTSRSASGCIANARAASRRRSRRGAASGRDYEEFWALRDISVTIPKGSTYGFIGHNGSGKSTLLRLMAGIHPPTSGTVTTEGRISALLELGAGFHPELSGRENVYLNGSILGLTRREVNSVLGEIIEFSGLEDFIDSPVKHYSSGMYVRLGFAGRGARESRDPDDRRSDRGRRRRVPAPLLRLHLQAPPPRRHDRDGLARRAVDGADVRRGRLARPRPAHGEGRPVGGRAQVPRQGQRRRERASVDDGEVPVADDDAVVVDTDASGARAAARSRSPASSSSTRPAHRSRPGAPATR